jgi:hypothetical protein
MRRATSVVITVLWGLWFGGVITLFLAVTAIFAEFHDRHDLAGLAANHVFRVFNAYQLALAAALLLATFVWYLLGPRQWKMGLFVVFALATVAACVIAMYLAPEITRLRDAHMTQSDEFKRLHGYSMLVYLVESLFLLAGGIYFALIRE